MLRAPPDVIKGASEALVAHLGKADMLLAVDNNPILLRSRGNRIHQIAIAVKGLLGESEGTDLLKETPRLFCSSEKLVEQNFETLCGAFDRDHVLKAVQSRPSLLYDGNTAKRAVTTGRLTTLVKA